MNQRTSTRKKTIVDFMMLATVGVTAEEAFGIGILLSGLA